MLVYTCYISSFKSELYKLYIRKKKKSKHSCNPFQHELIKLILDDGHSGQLRGGIANLQGRGACQRQFGSRTSEYQAVYALSQMRTGPSASEWCGKSWLEAEHPDLFSEPERSSSFCWTQFCGTQKQA